MNEEFYCSLKLVSGEEIFSIVSTTDDEELLILQDPVSVKVVHSSRGSFIRVEPWMHVPRDDFFFISIKNVMTMTEIEENHEILEYYNEYLQEQNEERFGFPSQEKKPNLSKKMGYVGTVDQARKDLEKIFKIEKDTKTGIATHV